MKVKKFILAVVSVVFAYALLSCDVGLGAAVDTQAPTLNVTYPATLSTVRGQFVFGGTCADDQKVTSVTVRALNSELGKSYGPYAATVADDAKSWTFSFNKKAEGKDSYNGWEMPDGKYTLEAVARDASGKSSGTGAITIDIDNTEPIFILNSPGTTDIKNPTVSGSSFKITGTIADDHSIKYMRVNVYENEGGRKGKLRRSIIEENIETSGGTSVALFKKTDPVYTELYGGDIKDASSIGTKTFFCEIELEDSAYEYNDFKNNASGKTGNVSKKVYLYDSVYKKFQSSSGYGLEAAKIKSIVNETLTEVNGTAAAQIRTEFLNSAAQSSLAFGLNPNANPKYVVQGFDVDSVSDIDKTGASSQSISVQVNAGLDGTNVLPETMCVYVFGPFESITEDTVSSIYDDPAEYDKTNAALVKEKNSSYEGSSLATYTFNIKLPKAISPFKTYIVAASGTDADGNDFDNDGTVFAFRGAQTGAAPALAINTPANSAMFNSSKDLLVAGTVSYEGGIDENNLSLDWEVTITDENDSNKVVKTYSGTRSGCTVNKDGSWSLSIPADDVPAYDADKKNGKVYTYSVKVTATGSNKLKAVAERSFHVDLKPPVLSGPEVTKTVKNAAGSDCVNGTIYISGGVDENYRKTFTLTVTDSSDSGVKKEFSYNAGQFNSEPIDTTEFKDGANLIITLAAEDKAGNKSEPSVKTIKIDQSTDRPVVAITNASADVKADEIAVGKNLFNSTTNSTLNITVTDDDGISAPVIVNVYALTSGGTADKKNAVHTEEFKDFTIGTTSANLTFNLPKTEGKYAVEVTARDTLYETATKENKVNHENTSGITYYVAVDNGAPSLSIESKSGAYQVQDADFIVTGKVSDTSGARLFVSSENINSIPAASDTKSIEITPKTGTSFTTKVNAGTTSGTKYFVAFDAYGQLTSTEFKWKVDGKAPTIAPDFPFKPDPESWFNSSAVGILLPLADSWDKDIEKVIDDPSNISSVIATFTAADGTVKATPLTLGGAYSADKYENQYYKYSTTLNFDADAKYDVSVTATDNAGNKGVFGPYKYNIDTTAPTVNVGDYVANLTGKEMNEADFKFTIPVTISDVTSGIKDIIVKKGNEVLAENTHYTKTDPLTGDVYTFEFKKDVLTTGTYAFTFTAEDNAGNTSEASANVSVDKTAPAITVKGVSPVVAAAGGNKVNGKITVTGTVTDETKLGTTGAVTLNIKKTDGTSAKTAKTDLSGGTYGEWSFVIDTTTLDDNSTYTLEVTAVDAVGNTETNSKTKINVDQSTDTPSITPSNYDAGINSADGVGVKGDEIKNLFGTVSNNKLSGTAFDDDGVKTVTVEYREAGSTGAYISKKVIENGTSTTAPFTFALSSKEAKYEVKITVTDTEGNAKGTYAAPSFYIGVSSGAPALKVDAQSSNYTAKSAELSVESTVTSNVATTLTAGYTVNSGETTSSAVSITPLNDKDNVYHVSLTVPATVKDKDVLAITYTATDIFGQSTSDVHTYTIDNTAPVLASAFYSSNDLKPTVNKKDPASSWYKDESLPFDIKYYDGGCGVERVEYTFTPQGGTAVTGSGIPKKVTADGKKYYQYTAAISGFAVGTNTLVFTAVDAAGNKSTSTTLNVRCDNVAPSLELVSIDDETAYDGRGKLVNGTKDVKFIVKATDEASGIASVKYGNVEGTADQSGQYSFTIKSKSLATMDVNATATDQAGNTTTTKLFNIILDNVAPVVNITSSLDKDTSTPAVEVNGTIALEGNSSDGSYALTATPVFWYTLTKPTAPVTSTEGEGWTRIFEKGTSNITKESTPTAWKSLPIDTKSKFGTLTDATHVYVMAAVTDSAQNTGYSPVLDLVVDQNTDRPQIKITSPKSLKDMGKTGTTIWQKNTKVIEGRISDDDGIESLEYSFKDPNDETFDSSIDWIEVTPNGDSWEIEAKEGANKIYFRVTDTEGTTFTSSKTSGLTAPYITDGTNKFGTAAAAAADSVLYVTVDTTPPVISELKFDTKGTTATTATYTGLQDVSSLLNTIVGGKTKKWLKIRAHATDDNGIKSVTVSIDGINEGKPVAATKVPDKDGEYYELADIDLSGLHSGYIDAVVTATDNAGTTSSTTLKINVDNTSPELKVTYPGTDTASKVTRIVTMKGIASDNNAGIESIKYKMGPISYTKSDRTDWTEWRVVKNQISWEIPFESTTKDNLENILTYITDSNISEEETPGSALYKVYVSFRVTDNLGNVNEIDGKESGNYILVDAEGGKPIADVSYPETGATVGGSLTIIGTATDDSGVKEVQVQLDVNGDGNFDQSDYDIIKTWTASDGTPSMQLGTNYIDDDTDWYITATGTNSWKLLVPTMKIAENTTLAEKEMSLRVRAWDNDKHTRGWGKTVKVKIDVKAPQVENVALVQYKSGSSGETSVSRTYSSGMYITKPETGKDWYLTGTISSTSLSSVTINSDAESVNKISYEAKDPSVTADGKYTFSAPVTIIGDGKTSATINVSGESGYTTTYPVLFSVDSQAPQMYSTDGSLAADKTTSLRLTSGGKNVDESNAVVNSNVVYTFGDVVEERGSGLNYIAFYFKRIPDDTVNGRIRVYNPMFNTDGDNRTDIDTEKTEGTSSGDVYINSDGLPVMYMKDAERSTETSFSHSSISGNKNIRVGGLIKLGGSYVRISSVNKDEVTFAPSKAESFTEAEFVYAQIVDHEITEGPTGDDYKNVSNDDGDEMIETLKAEGFKYTWTASIFSDRIPDGPVEIHVVTIDKAGNINRGSIATSIQNKRPRIAKVLLGTDLDHNGTYDFYSDSEIKYEGNVTQATYNNRNFGEFNYYSAVDANGVAQSSVTLSSEKFKIKNGMCILPEFIGGNGTLKYNMIVGDRAAEGAQKGTDTLKTLTTGTDSLKVANRDGTKAKIDEVKVNDDSLYFSHFPQGGILLDNEALASHESETPKYFAFTFWDETEETVQGTDSQWALLNIPVIVDVKDDTKPNASFNPFFWNGKGKGNNSLAYDKDGKALGHIELETDLTAALKTSPYGTGPKVSGKIVLRGTASDETLLTGLSVKAASVKAAETEIASAKYENGVWSSANGLTVTNVREVDQNGHEVTWELEYETPSAQKDLELTVTATDGGTNSSPEATESTAPALGTKEEKRTALYTVDVVPYVTNVKTMLSTVGGKEEAAWSTYGRTSTGAYVAGQSWAKNTGITGEKSGSAETVTLYGFNLAGGTVESSNGGSATLSTVSDTDNSFSFSVSGFKSGDYTVTAVNGIPSINNINSNDSKGSYKGSEAAQKYNRMPNGTTNNNLTDDFKMNIWDIRYDAATSQGGTLKEAVMRIAPDSDQIGFAFTNGASKFSMGDKKDGNSYQIWQSNYADFNNVSFVYDKNGNSYGTATGLDTYPDGKDDGDFAGRFTFMSSQWGVCNTGDMNDNYWGTKKLRMESIGIKKSNVQGSYQDTCIMDTYRFRSPTLATTMHGDSTSVYLAYYDTFQRQIRFRYGTFKTDAVGQSDNEWNNNRGFDQFTDQVRVNDLGGKCAFDARKDTYSLIAGKDADDTNVDTGNVCTPSNSMASTCVAIDAIEGSSPAEDIVVAAWCTGSGVAFAYKKNPYTDNDADQSHTNTDGYWSTAVEVFSGACEDVSIKADASGAVHISAYNKADQSLVYRYINKDRTTMGDVVTVDSYQIVGSRTQIDVQKEGSYYVPYISYYNPATQKTKLAYLLAGENYSAQGVKDDDTFTGNWEVSVIPTSSDIQEDHTNIGLWKDSEGKRRSSVGVVVNNGQINNDYGQTSGNGTNNPVVGYATVIGIRGFIETAQMR